jgi:hypothetical protein
VRLLEEHPELVAVLNGEKEFDFSQCYTVNNPQGAMAVEDVAAAIILHRGELAAIAKLLGRSRMSVSNFIARHQDLTDLRVEVFESALDAIESSYLEDALQGDPSAKKFFLTTRAKARGYTTRVESSGPEGGPIQAEIVDPVEEARRAAFVLAQAANNKENADG